MSDVNREYEVPDTIFATSDAFNVIVDAGRSHQIKLAR